MLLTCLTSNGNGRCLGEGRLLRNHHKLCAFLHLNMQHTAAKQSSGKWQTFFMSIALVSFFFDEEPFISVAGLKFRLCFALARFLVACMWQVGQLFG